MKSLGAGHRALLLGLACWLMTPPGWAQDPPEEPPPSADGQAVDEEEAEFRRRMEMDDDDGDYGDLTRPDIVDVDLPPTPVDPLPPESREHLEQALRDLIIENGRWDPADAQREAPFEPSEAAQSDPQLEALEREEWTEMVEQYHERERAAAAQAGGAGTGQGSGQGGDGGGGSGSGAGQGSGSGSGAPDSSGMPPGGAERPPEGEPFNALDFLRERGDVSGEPTESEVSAGEPGSGNAPSADADAGSGATGESPGDQESSTVETGVDERSEEGSEDMTETQPPAEAAGSESSALPASTALSGASSPASSMGSEDTAEAAATPPGSDAMPSDDSPEARMATQDLSVLFPDADESGAPGAEAQPASEPMTPSNPASPEAPDGAPPQATPSTGFLAWLQSLFTEESPEDTAGEGDRDGQAAEEDPEGGADP